MVHVCDLVNRHSRIKSVGLCHQLLAGYCFAGIALGEDLGIQVPEGITGMHSDPVENNLRARVVRQVLPLIEIYAPRAPTTSPGFSIHHKQTGEDLYPLFRQRFNALDPDFAL